MVSSWCRTILSNLIIKKNHLALDFIARWPAEYRQRRTQIQWIMPLACHQYFERVQSKALQRAFNWLNFAIISRQGASLEWFESFELWKLQLVVRGLNSWHDWTIKRQTTRFYSTLGLGYRRCPPTKFLHRKNWPVITSRTMWLPWDNRSQAKEYDWMSKNAEEYWGIWSNAVPTT